MKVSGMRRLRYAVKHAFWSLTNRWPSVDPAVLAHADSPYCVGDAATGTDYDFPERRSGATADRLTSGLCYETQLNCPAFRYWIERLHDTPRMHRKQWEFAYVIQTLYERGMLQEGRRGLVFAVGMEPLPSLFASMGCQIVATDLDVSDHRSDAWVQTGQHSSSVAPLNRYGLCSPDDFASRVSYRPVDMNAIPSDLTGFDFTWSSCSFEHCGSIELGQRFLQQQMRCLRPGGVAVHTTEFNLSSNRRTRSRGNTVLFRRCDVETMMRQLIDDGHHVEPLNLHVGGQSTDYDVLPYSYDRHMKLEFRSYVATSLGLIVRKSLDAATQAA